MFEAARHGRWRGTGKGWAGVEAGGIGKWQRTENRGELGKTSSFHCSCAFCSPRPSLLLSEPSSGAQSWGPLWLSSFKHSSSPFTPNRWFPWGSEAGLPLQAPP